ncbi:hypothetical protein ACTMSW_28525 [Micromonospora sp. BQ11]|uniref:hypothetical protein n=1 Tax=Micromonospora sp. BQ11 TaxID=3452212 RepID=UPI003F88EFCF
MISHRRLGVGCAVLLVSLGTVACGAERSLPAVPTPVPTTGAAVRPDEGTPPQVGTGDPAGLAADDVVFVSGARVALSGSDVGTAPQAIRDESAEEWPAGDYRLVVRCAGQGVVVARLRLGGTATGEESLTCDPSGGTVTVDVRLASSATGSAVSITPTGTTEAMVSYRIQRL